MLRFYSSFWFFLAFPFIGFSQSDQDHLQSLRVDIIYLASDYLEGRETGKTGERLAAQYIVSRFQKIGLEPAGEQGSFVQTFTFEHFLNANDSETRTGKNIIGYIDNKAESTVIIGAHYDHIGYGEFGSKADGEPAIHNGADDNASGVGALLYLANQLKWTELKNNNYLFIAFSGEEMGLYGSQYFTEHPTIDLSTVNFMINLNRVGRLGEDKRLVINGVGTSPAWKETIPRVDAGYLQIETTHSGIGSSDHNSFYMINIPAIHLTTGDHEDYHRPSDDSALINYMGILNIGDYLIRMLAEMNQVGKLPFTPTIVENEEQGPKYKVTLGIRPDYMSAGEGVRVEGVMDGRPAQKAGIQKGDLIIQMGKVEVTNIYQYMEGLGQFNPGEKATIKVKRGEKIMAVEVEF